MHTSRLSLYPSLPLYEQDPSSSSVPTNPPRNEIPPGGDLAVLREGGGEGECAYRCWLGDGELRPLFTLNFCLCWPSSGGELSNRCLPARALGIGDLSLLHHIHTHEYQIELLPIPYI